MNCKKRNGECPKRSPSMPPLLKGVKLCTGCNEPAMDMQSSVPVKRRVKRDTHMYRLLKDEHERAERLGTNCRWLIDQIDKIHRRLCPNQNGTWQDRVSQAVIAAERAHDSPAIQCYRAPEGQGMVRYIKTRGIVTDAIGSEGVANPVEIAQNMVSIGTGTYWTPCTLEEYQKAEDEKAAGK